MSKITIPKHSADLDEMTAVLKIHYEADDWVKGPEFKRRLMNIIGSGQYPTSYPKKAQVPAYFGFLESHVTPGGKITERKITESGKAMYEAIINDDVAERRRLIMEALENMKFGRNNSGCTSSNADIDPPIIFIRCILDTGYCTSSEYAYLVWAMNDACKNYYESLDVVINKRSGGGVDVPDEASDYKDWKPILAMLRWGFLIKSYEDSRKLLLHPSVIELYIERLQKLVVYNIDKHNASININYDDEEINTDSELVYKPFVIEENIAYQVAEGKVYQTKSEIEKQKLIAGDQVLFVDKNINKLLAFHSYLICGLKNEGDGYSISLKKQYAINKEKEDSILQAIKLAEEKSQKIMIRDAIKSLVSYENYNQHLVISGQNNKDILPAYLLVKALSFLDHLTIYEQDYLIFSLTNGKETYSDAITSISIARKENKNISTIQMEGYAKQKSIQLFKEKGIFETYLKDGKQGIKISSPIKNKYSDVLSRLSFYAVDIKNQMESEEFSKEMIPQVIKAIEISDTNSIEEGHVIINNNQIIGADIVQGDYIVFIAENKKELLKLYVYQIDKCKKNNNLFEIEFNRRYVINSKKQEDIIKMIIKGE